MNALVQTRSPSLLMDPVAFDHLQRVGRMLAMSPLFPAHLRPSNQEQAIANGVLVMNMAARLNEDPLTVAQNIYFVGGRPGWSASYMIGKANMHGVFKNPIDWKVEGSGDTLSVTAHTELAKTGKPVQITCDMKMAKAEGWTKNSKYQSMPEVMLRYRSATFLIRAYCPEVMVGIPTTIDHELGSGMKDITPDYDAGSVGAMGGRPIDAQEQVRAKPKPGVVDHAPASEGEENTAPEKSSAQSGESAENKPETETIRQGGGAVRMEQAVTVDDDGVITDAAADARDAHIKTFDLVTKDLIDGAPVVATKRFYAEALAAMKVEAPDLFTRIEETFAEVGE